MGLPIPHDIFKYKRVVRNSFLFIISMLTHMDDRLCNTIVLLKIEELRKGFVSLVVFYRLNVTKDKVITCAKGQTLFLFVKFTKKLFTKAFLGVNI